MKTPKNSSRGCPDRRRRSRNLLAQVQGSDCADQIECALSEGEMLPRSVLPAGPRLPATWQLIRYSFSPLTYLEQCAARYGEAFTVRQAGYGTFVILWSPEAVRDVFKGDPQVLHSGEGNELLRAAVGPTSVLVVDGQPHASQRRVLSPPLK